MENALETKSQLNCDGQVMNRSKCGVDVSHDVGIHLSRHGSTSPDSTTSGLHGILEESYRAP